MKEAILDYYIFNGKLVSSNDDKYFEGIEDPTVYEVIRIADGVVLFFEDHMMRMRKSIELLGYKLKKMDEEILIEIHRLIVANKVDNLNVKLICTKLDQEQQDFFVFFVESYYPSADVYAKGIHTVTLSIERENPNVKTVNRQLKETVKKIRESTGAFEVLLINHERYITEGSRSNIFFIKADRVYTAPEGDVLLGVTRNHIMKVCQELGIEVEEKMMHMNDMESLQGAFMTGTSVNVLPISCIDDVQYPSVDNELIRRISEGYQRDMYAYMVKKHRNKAY
ncbi:MAG: aminotransferase class IV [Bacillota bacterium]